jgi:hypothetical protein
MKGRVCDEDLMRIRTCCLLRVSCIQGELPLSSALGLQVSYSSPQNTVTISSTSSNAFSLLSAVSQPLRRVFDLWPNSAVAQDLTTPAAAGGPQQQQQFPLQALQTAYASLTVSSSQGVQEAVIGLQGQYSPSVLSAALGLPFVLPDDLFNVGSDPLLLYNAVPAVMYVSVTADVPAIGVQGMTSTINIQPGQQVALQVRETQAFLSAVATCMCVAVMPGQETAIVAKPVATPQVQRGSHHAW